MRIKPITWGHSILKSKDSKYGASRVNISLMQSIEDHSQSFINNFGSKKVDQPQVLLSMIWDEEEQVNKAIKSTQNLKKSTKNELKFFKNDLIFIK